MSLTTPSDRLQSSLPKPLPTLLYLCKSDLQQLGGDSSELYVQAITDVLAVHAQGNVVQPLKPYLRWSSTDPDKTGHIADRIIAMPAYVGQSYDIAGIKWIGSKHDNPAQLGRERASGLIILNEPGSNYPIAILEASLISSMRTAAVTVVAAQHLARQDFTTVSCLGCGLIAKTQLRSLLEQFPSIQTINLYDLNSEAAEQLLKQLKQHKSKLEGVIAASAEAAVRPGEVVITCTVTDRPYLPFEWLRPGAFVSNVSIMDLHKDVFLQADKVVVDDWKQANREKKILNQLVLEGQFSQAQLHAELGEIVIGAKPGRQTPEEVIVLNPMGMAVEDIACAQRLYQKALDQGVGKRLSLY